MFEAVFLGRSRRQYDALTWREQAEVDQIIRLIELDPRVDNLRTFVYLHEGSVMRIYDDGRWQIAYRVVEDRYVEVYGITRLA